MNCKDCNVSIAIDGKKLCIDCKKRHAVENVYRWRLKNPEKQRVKNAKEREKYREKRNAYGREYMRHYQKDIKKVRAREAVRRAVISGILIKYPCEVCLKLPSEGHHDDYNKPLDIRWFCKYHHEEYHRYIDTKLPVDL